MATLHLAATAVLLDIEGTIASQSFVLRVLYAYARARIPSYVAEHAAEPAVAAILDDARRLAGGGDPVAALIGWQDRDEKVPPLKTLQGLIWESGYRDGAFKGHIFPDALAALTAWHAAGLPLFIYSSGSVKAQTEFFAFNEGGDLRPLFSGHFDTASGAKVEPSSYGRIAAAIGHRAEAIVFLSDNPRELVAARSAGLQVVQVVKEGTAADPRFPAIADFADLEVAPESAAIP